MTRSLFVAKKHMCIESTLHCHTYRIPHTCIYCLLTSCLAIYVYIYVYICMNSLVNCSQSFNWFQLDIFGLRNYCFPNNFHFYSNKSQLFCQQYSFDYYFVLLGSGSEASPFFTNFPEPITHFWVSSLFRDFPFGAFTGKTKMEKFSLKIESRLTENLLSPEIEPRNSVKWWIQSCK